MTIKHNGIKYIGNFRICPLFAIPLFILLAMSGACKKTSLYDVTPAVIQPINLLDDGVTLRVNLLGQHPVRFSTLLSLANKTYLKRNIFVNSFPQRMDIHSQPDTMPHDRPVISTDLQLETGKSYSMFIYGEKTTASYLLHEDELPVIRWNDTLTYIRFANFSENQTISVNLKGQEPGSYIQALPFKSITGFAAMKISLPLVNLEFEIRDQASGNLLAVYNVPKISTDLQQVWVNKPSTFVFTGHSSGTGTNQQKLVLMMHR